MNKYYTEPDIYMENESLDLIYQGDIKKDNILREAMSLIIKGRTLNESDVYEKSMESKIGRYIRKRLKTPLYLLFSYSSKTYPNSSG